MIVIADLHMGKTSDSFIAPNFVYKHSQTLDILTRLRQVLARAKMTKQSIIIAGDVFNRVNPTTNIIAAFMSWLTECRRNSVNVYIIPGNHDAGVDWTSASMLRNMELPNVTVVTSPSPIRVEEKGGISNEFLFLPHVPLATQETAERGHGSVCKWVHSMYPSAEVIITHGTVDDVNGYDNDIFYEAGTALRIEPGLFKNLKLMVLGHIHDHKSGKNWVYPGSITVNNFGEVDERKGWVEFDIVSYDWVWHEFEQDSVTRWVQVDLDLRDRDERSIKEEDVAEIAEDAILKVVVYAKRHGVIDEQYIRKLFNTYGLVTRFEVRVDDTEGSVREPVREKVSHEEMLDEYLEQETDASKEVKDVALGLGKKIIREVTGG